MDINEIYQTAIQYWPLLVYGGMGLGMLSYSWKIEHWRKESEKYLAELKKETARNYEKARKLEEEVLASTSTPSTCQIPSLEQLCEFVAVESYPEFIKKAFESGKLSCAMLGNPVKVGDEVRYNFQVGPVVYTVIKTPEEERLNLLFSGATNDKTRTFLTAVAQEGYNRLYHRGVIDNDNLQTLQ